MLKNSLDKLDKNSFRDELKAQENEFVCDIGEQSDLKQLQETIHNNTKYFAKECVKELDQFGECKNFYDET